MSREDDAGAHPGAVTTVHEVVRFGGRELRAAARIGRSRPPRARTNVERSLSLPEVAPLLDAVAARGGVVVGGAALSLAQHARDLPVREVRDVDVVAVPANLERLRREFSAEVYAPANLGRGMGTFWRVAVARVLRVELPQRLRAPHRAGHGYRYGCATVPFAGAPLDVDFQLSTTLHPSRLTCRRVRVGASVVWTLDAASQLQEATAILAHFARWTEAMHAGLRKLAHKRVAKARERIAALLPLLETPAPA